MCVCINGRLVARRRHPRSCLCHLSGRKVISNTCCIAALMWREISTAWLRTRSFSCHCQCKVHFAGGSRSLNLRCIFFFWRRDWCVQRIGCVLTNSGGSGNMTPIWRGGILAVPRLRCVLQLYPHMWINCVLCMQPGNFDGLFPLPHPL